MCPSALAPRGRKTAKNSYGISNDPAAPLAAALPVYTRAMAKVMISLPDELLGRLDDHARRIGKTRSGLLRELAERELRADIGNRSRRIRGLVSTAAPHGGDAARHVREQRRAR